MGKNSEILFGDRDWLIFGKFESQHSLISQVSRPALIGKLNRSAQGVLTLIVTPAGYGKSTLLSQWYKSLTASSHIAAWLTLDESDRVAHQFCSHVVLSLCYTGAEMGALEKLAEQEFIDVPIDAVIRTLSATLARQSKPVIIIIEDYHRVGDGHIDAVMEKILDLSTESTHFVVSSREKPGFNFSGLKANGLVQEFDSNDLRFSIEDTCRLFPDDCKKSELETLARKTEGWAVALQLARSILDDETSLANVIQNLSGVTDDLAEYLNQQIYGGLSDEIKQVLRQTSILDRFNVSLANAVSERIDCLDILDRLKRRHSLIVSTQRETRWYRYHHLLLQFLNNELERVEPELIPTLHTRAADWYERNNFPALAVKHACLAGNLVQASRIVEDAGGWELILFGGIPSFRRLIDSFSITDFSEFPRIEIARIYYLIKNGDILQARRFYNQLLETNRSMLAGNSEAARALSRDTVLIGALLDVYEDRITCRDELEEIAGISVKLARSDAAGHSIVTACSAVSALNIGSFRVALDYATHCCRYMREISCMQGLSYALIHQGRASLYLGQFREAGAIFTEALEMNEENFGAESNLKAVAEILTASADYITDRETFDQERLTQALIQMEHYDGWFDIYAAGYGTVASIAYRRAGLDAARDILQRGRRMAEIRYLPRLGEFIDACEYLYLVRSGELREARTLARLKKLSFNPDASNSVNWWRDHLVGTAEGLMALAAHGNRRALEVAGALGNIARSGNNLWHEMEASLLKSLALLAGRQDERAFAGLTDTLDVAAKEGTYRILLDFGKPLEELLSRLYRLQRGNLRLSSFTGSFVKDCLARYYKTPYQLRGKAPEALLLSPRELEILQELALGFSNKDIARMLDMTENTVKFHMKNIFKKLDVDNRIRAVSTGQEMGLIS